MNRLKKRLEKQHPSEIVTNNIKYLGVTLTKEVKDLYDKNFKSLKKEIKEDLRRWKDLPCSCIGRMNIVASHLTSKKDTTTRFFLKQFTQAATYFKIPQPL